MPNRLKKLLPYIVSVLITLAVGFLGAMLTMDQMDFYETIQKPAYAPPGWVFPIVWVVLYILMGISAGIIYKSDNPAKKPALTVYAVQLAVNFFWSLIFFGEQNFLLAFIWIILLIALVTVMLFLFFRISETAAYLNIPYLLWIIFAAFLNLSVFSLNR